MFENWHTIRSRTLSPLHRTIDDYLPSWESSQGVLTGVTLRSASIVGLAASIGGSLYFFANPTAQSSTEAALIANSALYSHREELCVPFANPKTLAGFELTCSPIFNKNRAPGGKLIIDRLADVKDRAEDAAIRQQVLAAIMPYFSLPEEITSPSNSRDGVLAGSSGDEEIFVVPPGEAKPIGSQIADADGSDELASLMKVQMSEADRLRKRLHRSDRKRPTPTTHSFSPSNVDKTPAVATWKRCKARSYWSTKHSECRRRR